MSDGERTLADGLGKFAQVVRDGRKVPDVEWIDGRILLSTRRLVLAGNEGTRTIPLSEIRAITGRQNADRTLAAVPDYLSLHLGGDVVLVSSDDHGAFERTLYRAILDGAVVLVRHPAVEGGVVRDPDWTKGRLKVEDGNVALALASGEFVEIEIDDVGAAEVDDREAGGETRTVVEVAHTQGGTAVETHVSGATRHVTVLASLLRTGEATDADVDLSERESEVLLALYSGVSPFQIPEFVGLDVETVEEIFDRLVEAGLLEQRRVRREVELKARGRHIAGEATDEE